MSKLNRKFQSPLGKARGLGSAHEGTHHWLNQRLTALTNFPLILWLIWSMISLQGADYETFTAWLAQPWNALLMILVIGSVYYHAMLGLQVIFEDYVSCKASKFVAVTGTKIGLLFLAVVSIFSILKVAL